MVDPKPHTTRATLRARTPRQQPCNPLWFGPGEDKKRPSPAPLCTLKPSYAEVSRQFYEVLVVEVEANTACWGTSDYQYKFPQ